MIDANSGLDLAKEIGARSGMPRSVPAATWRSRAGNEIVTLSGDAVEPWREATAPVIDAWIAGMEGTGASTAPSWSRTPARWWRSTTRSEPGRGEHGGRVEGATAPRRDLCVFATDFGKPPMPDDAPPEKPRTGPALDHGPLPGLVGYTLRRAQLAVFQAFPAGDGALGRDAGAVRRCWC